MHVWNGALAREQEGTCTHAFPGGADDVYPGPANPSRRYQPAVFLQALQKPERYFARMPILSTPGTASRQAGRRLQWIEHRNDDGVLALRKMTKTGRQALLLPNEWDSLEREPLPQRTTPTAIAVDRRHAKPPHAVTCPDESPGRLRVGNAPRGAVHARLGSLRGRGALVL